MSRKKAESVERDGKEYPTEVDEKGTPATAEQTTAQAARKGNRPQYWIVAVQRGQEALCVLAITKSLRGARRQLDQIGLILAVGWAGVRIIRVKQVYPVPQLE